MHHGIIRTIRLLVIVLLSALASPDISYGAVSLEINTPRAGDHFTTGDEMRITWSAPRADNVSFFLISEDGEIKPVISGIPNTGEYVWRIDMDDILPGQTKHYYLKGIAYRTSDNVTIFARSEGYFAVTRPEGVVPRDTILNYLQIGEVATDTLYVGDVHTITWRGPSGRTDIDLMRTDTNKAARIVVGFTPPADETEHTYTYMVPPVVEPGSGYRLRITVRYPDGTQRIGRSKPFAVRWRDAKATAPPVLGVPADATPVTLEPIEVTPTSAVLVGAINPNRRFGVYVWFLVEPPLPAKSYTTSRIFIPAENRVFEKHALITGLRPNATYRYRMEGEVRGKRTYGEYVSFTTKPAIRRADGLFPARMTGTSSETLITSPASIQKNDRELGTVESNVIVSFRPLHHTLKPGMEGGEVRILQQMLAMDPDVYPEGIVSGYYGTLTRRAVERFQKKYDIVAVGTPDTTGYGMVGPRTRAKLNSIFVRDKESAPMKVGPAANVRATAPDITSVDVTPASTTTAAPHVETVREAQTLLDTLRQKVYALREELRALFFLR